MMMNITLFSIKFNSISCNIHKSFTFSFFSIFLFYFFFIELNIILSSGLLSTAQTGNCLFTLPRPKKTVRISGSIKYKKNQQQKQKKTVDFTLFLCKVFYIFFKFNTLFGFIHKFIDYFI